MRHATLALGFVLLAACASTPPPPPGPATTPVLCNSQPDATAVLINIDPAAPAGSQVAPKDCTVKPRTMITWRGTQAFKLVFDKKFGPNGEKTFDSQDVNGNQEVTLRARSAWWRKSYRYDAFVGTTKLDPTIIVDPH